MLLYREIGRILSIYLYVLALVLLLPLGLALYCQYHLDPGLHPQPHSSGAFAATCAICIALGVLIHFCGGRKATGRYYKREALALVVSIWFVSALVGGLPFYLGGVFDSFLDSYFEAMSGLTTTGATLMHAKNFDPGTGQEVPVYRVFSDLYQIAYSFHGTIDPVVDSRTGEVLFTGIEAVGRAMLFWRSFMQWLGGMGIVVLFVAILPALGVGGKSLYQAEVPGPTKDTLVPRIKETAGLLWKLYLGFSLVQIVLLMGTNREMPLFDAVCITFSSLSTGGFSIKNGSIGSYQSAGTEWIVIIFMLVGSVNFALYFHCLRGKIYRMFEPEFLVFFAVIFFSCYLAVWNLVGTPEYPLVGESRGVYSLTESIRYGCFQSISAQTSTGFSTADYDKWPFINQVQMLMVMFVGAMAGSTGGGIKIMRHIMLFRLAQFRVESIFRPQAVRKFRIGNREIGQEASVTVLVYFLIVVSLTAVATLLLALDGVDPETALATSACMINNIGMAFRMGGPTESFAFLSPLAKVMSSLFMVLGRLEFFAVLVVLTPSFWRE